MSLADEAISEVVATAAQATHRAMITGGCEIQWSGDPLMPRVVPLIPAAKWCIHYRLAGRIGATTPEPAEGAMHDRNVLIGKGATDIRAVEVKR